jgi:Cys-tRNA synthase (O-phospho-L-seryl-tRNA:Cys-tRNA synthase)
MTDEQINAAIAEIHLSERYPDGYWVRDYCSDLNVMHEAEKVILPKFSHFYANKLALITGVDCSDETAFFCATARQRAEAFLRTLGKWKSTTEEFSVDGSIR